MRSLGRREHPRRGPGRSLAGVFLLGAVYSFSRGTFFRQASISWVVGRAGMAPVLVAQVEPAALAKSQSRRAPPGSGPGAVCRFAPPWPAGRRRSCPPSRWCPSPGCRRCFWVKWKPWVNTAQPLGPWVTTTRETPSPSRAAAPASSPSFPVIRASSSSETLYDVRQLHQAGHGGHALFLPALPTGGDASWGRRR